MSRFETFAFLPPFSPHQIEMQAETMLGKGYIPTIEYADNPTTADFYWEQWPLTPHRFNATTGAPMPITPGQVVAQIEACAARNPYSFVKLTGYNPKTRQIEISFIAKTPIEGQ